MNFEMCYVYNKSMYASTSMYKDIYYVKGVWLLKLETLVRVSNVRNQGQSVSS